MATYISAWFCVAMELTWCVEEVFPLRQSDLIVTIFIEKFFYVIDVLVARSK